MSERHIPPRRERPALVKYAVAVASVGIAVIGALALGPTASPGPLFFLAVILSAWFGGGRPGLVAAGLATLGHAYFLPPLHSLFVDSANRVPLLLFLLSALLVSWLTVRMNRTLVQLERARDELETRVQERTADLEQSNARLRDSQALLEQAQRIAHVGYWDRDLDTDRVNWSHETYRIYGLEPQGGLLTAAALWELIHPEDRPRVVAAMEQVQQGGTRVDVEYRIVQPGGDVRIVHSAADVTRDASGRVRRLFGIVQDITNRKGVEDRLRAEIAERARVEETLREQAALLDLTHDTVFVRDMDDAITYWNRGAKELYGWDKSEILGKTTHEVAKTVFPAPLGDINRTLLATGRWEGQLVHSRRDGTRVVVASRWALQRDAQGHPVAILETNNDITEQQRAEVALRDSEEQWRAVFENNPTMYFMVDASGTILSVNPFGAEQLGYAVGELIGRPVLDVFHEDDRQSVQRAVAACLEQMGPAKRWESRKVRKDGSVLWVRETARAMLLKGRAVVLVVGEDVTDAKRGEEERQARRRAVESMDRVNRAIHGTNDLEKMMSDVLDATLGIFDCDRAWLLYPCDPDAPSHSLVMERTRPECPSRYGPGTELPRYPETLAALRSARAASGPVRFGPGGDEPLPAQIAKRHGVQSRVVMALYPRDEQPYMFGLSQVSHARVWSTPEALLLQEIGRRLEDALTSLSIFHRLRESEKRYRHIFESTGVSIWEEDFSRVKAAIDGLRSSGVQDFAAYVSAHPQFVREAIAMVKVSDVNDATVKLFGAKSKEDLLASLDRVFVPETEEVFRGELIALAEGRTYFESESVLQTLTGDRITVLFTITFPPSPARPDRVLVTIVDISERKRAEEALHKAQAELAHVTRVTTMGELASSIAHEVNQPLAAVTTTGNAGLRWLAAEPPNLERARTCLTRIVRDAVRASEVIARIRKLVKKSPPADESLDVTEAIQEVLAMASAEARGYQVTVQARCSVDVPPVCGDRIQLQQVILNLVMNAIEAMKTVTGRPRALLIRCEQNEPGSILVAVRDSGIGLDPQGTDRVFDAFYTTKPDGLGMGLSISRSIIEAHGGQLWAVVNDDHGATFQFTLPTDRGAEHD